MIKLTCLFKIIITFLILMILSCSGGEMNAEIIQYKQLKNVPAAKWDKLSQKKIYFGHQSVGKNILDGISEIESENPHIKLNIKKIENTDQFNTGMLAHSKVGKNTDPQSKIDDFVSFLNEGIGNNADAAFLKFCYVDFTENTTVSDIFEQYKKNVSELKIKYPDTKIIHFTVPLLSRKLPIKAYLKRLLKLKGPPETDLSNIKRNVYNDSIRSEFKDDLIFDLADFESTFPDGKKSTFIKDGKTYQALVNNYTYDGGHLNETGRKYIASKLLLFLVNNI